MVADLRPAMSGVADHRSRQDRPTAAATRGVAHVGPGLVAAAANRVVSTTDERGPRRVEDGVRRPRPRRLAPGCLRRSLMRTWDRLHVGGTWIEPTTSETIEIHSPHDGSVVGSAPCGGSDDIDRAVHAAREAFDDGPWPRLSVGERLALLRPFVDAYGQRIN